MKITLLSIFVLTLITGISQTPFSDAQSSVAIQGTFAIRDGISPNGNHFISYSLNTTTEEGLSHSYQLKFDALPNNIKDFSGKHVIVQGHFEDDGNSEDSTFQKSIESNNNAGIFNAHTINSYFEKTLQPSLPQTPRDLTEPANVVTLLVKFSDDPQEMHSQTFFNERFYTAPDSLNEFYKTSSYNQFSMTGSANDWVTLPSPNSSYHDGSFPLWEKVVDDAVVAHGITAGEFPNIDGLVIVTNNCIEPACSAWGDLAPNSYTITGVGTLNTAVSWLPDQTDDFWCCALGLDNGLGVPGHEVGHNLGFEHTVAPPGDWINAGGCFVHPCNDPYHDPWSVMSANTDRDGPSTIVMGQRDQVSWVTEANKVHVFDGTSSTITLDYINEPQDGANPQMGQIHLSDGTKYIFEAHKNELFNDTPFDNEGIVLYRYFPSGNQYAYLTFANGFDKTAQYSLVATSGAATQADFITANLDVGEIWTDATNNVTVETISKTSTTVTVTVNNNHVTPPCSPPGVGDWNVTTSCTMTANATAAGNVVIPNGVLLTIPNTITLTVPSGFNISIGSGGGILLEIGGTIIIIS